MYKLDFNYRPFKHGEYYYVMPFSLETGKRMASVSGMKDPLLDRKTALKYANLQNIEERRKLV